MVFFGRHSHADLARTNQSAQSRVRPAHRNRLEVVEIARRNLDRWLQTCSPRNRRALLDRRQILNRGESTVLTTLENDDARTRWLRQSSPFSGILTPEERNEIIQRYRA
jgi:hypothetical protein